MYRKFRNKKVTTDEGVFDSKFEYDYWIILNERQKRGEISDLKRQVSFELIPRQSAMVEVQLKTKTKLKEVFYEHPVYYIADFVYNEGERRIIIDCKGVKTPDYIIKRKLMRLRGTPITEIYWKRKKKKLAE